VQSLRTVEPEELSIGDLISALRRRRSIVYAVTIGFLFLAAIYCLFATRRYSSIGTIEVEKKNLDAAGLQDLTASDNAPADALEANINLQTQANILQSNTFALAAIQSLHLVGTHDFPDRSVSDEAPGTPLEESRERLQPLLKRFHRHLRVSPIGGTRLILIEYSSPDPNLATKVVNFLIYEIRSQGFRARDLATAETSDWLTKQLADLRQQSEDAQARVVALQRETGFFSLGTDMQGHEQSYSGILDRLEKATTALNQAQQNRIVKQSIAQMAEHGNAEDLSSIAGNANGPPLESMAVIQKLRQQEAIQTAALVEAQAKFGASWPKVVELQANIHGLEEAINDEFQRIRSRARSDYQIAIQTETSTRNEYEDARRDAAKINDKAVAFAVAKQEADQSRQLYEDVLKRFKEASLLEGWRSSNITVIDRGRASAKPEAPNIPLYLGLALFGGFGLGVGSAIAADLFDSRLKGVRQIERSCGIGAYGVLPRFRERDKSDSIKPVIPLRQLGGAYEEAIRRMSLKLLSQRNGAPATVVLITSPVRQQGKTFMSASLAFALALAGRRVLLIDADLRHRKLSQLLSSTSQAGMNEVFSGATQVSPELAIAGIHGLDMLGAGILRSDPTRLLDRPEVETWFADQRNIYEFLILDSSALLDQTDALVLHPYADLTLVVARVGHLALSQVEYSIELMKQFGSPERIGVVVNGLDPSDAEYAACFGSHASRSLRGKTNATLT
jgi:succinoglycan biosynthesis transport protein ExoP